MKYNYYDYEKAYYMTNIEQCKKIALTILPKINNEKVQALLEKIKDIEWDWNYPEDKKQEILDIFSEIKIWIMVYSC